MAIPLHYEMADHISCSLGRRSFRMSPSPHDNVQPLVLGFKTCWAQSKYALQAYPNLIRIADPTCDEGCAKFDTVVRFEDFDKFKSEDCEWAGEASRQFVDLARPHQQKLAQLCDWAEKDAEREGAAILDSMSPEIGWWWKTPTTAIELASKHGAMSTIHAKRTFDHRALPSGRSRPISRSEWTRDSA